MFCWPRSELEHSFALCKHASSLRRRCRLGLASSWEIFRLLQSYHSTSTDSLLESSIGKGLSNEDQSYLCGCNEDLAVFGGTEIVHDAHEMQSFCPSFFCLRNMQIHLVTIKVSIVGTTDTLIETQRPAKQCHNTSICGYSITKVWSSLTPSCHSLLAFTEAWRTISIHLVRLPCQQCMA